MVSRVLVSMYLSQRGNYYFCNDLVRCLLQYLFVEIFAHSKLNTLVVLPLLSLSLFNCRQLYRTNSDTIVEEMIFSFLAAAITGYAEANGTTLVEAIKDILRYHIGEPQRTDERLREKGSISTTYKNLKLGVEIVKKGDRTMLLDESGANPKLHDKLKDIKTTNGYLHYIKSVLLPYDDIYGDGGSSSSSLSGSADETESPTVEMEDSDDMAPTAAP